VLCWSAHGKPDLIMTQSLNVLFISPTADCYIGGTETVVKQLGQRLKHQVRLTILSGNAGNGKGSLLEAEGLARITLPFIGRDTRLNRMLG